MEFNLPMHYSFFARAAFRLVKFDPVLKFYNSLNKIRILRTTGLAHQDLCSVFVRFHTIFRIHTKIQNNKTMMLDAHCQWPLHPQVKTSIIMQFQNNSLVFPGGGLWPLTTIKQKQIQRQAPQCKQSTIMNGSCTNEVAMCRKQNDTKTRVTPLNVKTTWEFFSNCVKPQSFHCAQGFWMSSDSSVLLHHSLIWVVATFWFCSLWHGQSFSSPVPLLNHHCPPLFCLSCTASSGRHSPKGWSGASKSQEERLRQFFHDWMREWSSFPKWNIHGESQLNHNQNNEWNRCGDVCINCNQDPTVATHCATHSFAKKVRNCAQADHNKKRVKLNNA